MKRWWLILLTLFIVVVAAIAYLAYSLYKPDKVDPLRAISPNAPVILLIEEPLQTVESLNKADYKDQLAGIPLADLLINQVQAIDSTIQKIDVKKKWSLEKQPMVAALHVVAADKVDYLYASYVGTLSKSRFYEVVSALNSNDMVTNNRTIRGERVYDITDRNSQVTFSCAHIDGVLLASYSSTLVEEAIMRWLTEDNILQSPSFQKAKESISGNPAITLLLNYEELDDFEPLLVDSKKTDLFNTIPGLAAWGQYEVIVGRSNIVYNGYTLPKKDTTFLSYLNNSDAKAQWAEMLPENVGMYVGFNVKDIESYLSRQDSADTELISYFTRWAGTHICFASLQTFSEDYKAQSFVMVESTNGEIAKQSLGELVRLNAGGEDFTSYSGYDIGKLKPGKPLNSILGNEFVEIAAPYYAVLDEHVVFANELSTLKQVIKRLSAQKVLSTSVVYQMLSKNLMKGTCMDVYMDPARMGEAITGVLSNTLNEAAEEGEKQFMHFSPMALQFQYLEGVYFTNGYIHYTGEVSADIAYSSNQMWQEKLNAPMAIAPTYVHNHYTGDLEVFVQDEQNYVYLFDKAGRKIWERKIDGRIVSEVFEIDYYKNNKIQYIFNTEDQVYLLARNAKDVANYPRRLPAKAANGIKLVDYDNGKNYRLFVACSNEKIYAYLHTFKPLTGWNPKPNAGVIEFPFMHFMSGGKDYIVGFNSNGTMFYFDRRGEKRVGVIFMKTHFDHPFYLEKDKGGNFNLVSIDTAGVIHSVDERGVVSKKETYGDIPYYDFLYADADADGVYEYIFLDSTTLTVTDQELKPEYTYTFPEAVNGEVFDAGSNYIGVNDKGHDLVYLFDRAGNLLEGFPLPGSTPFQVAGLVSKNEKSIVVGDKEGNITVYSID